MRIDAEDSYRNDAAYRRLVDSIAALIESAEFTPSEVRGAATLACIMCERRNATRPMFIPAEPRGMTS